MNRDEFWRLIDETRPGGEFWDEDAHIEALVGRLLALEPEEIISFGAHFDAVKAEAYRADLWDVAYIVLGGCSNDFFTYFRYWLIGQGRKAYETVLASPERVAEFIREGEDPTSQLFYSAASQAYEQKTGEEMPLAESDGPRKLVGKLSSREERKARYPRLWKQFMEG